MHWPTVPVRTNKRTVMVGKPTYKTADKPRKLAGRNGHKTTKTGINLTNVDFCYMIEKVAELCVSQPGGELKSTVIVIVTIYSMFNEHNTC